MDISWILIAVILVLVVAVVYLNSQIQSQNTSLADLRASVTKVISNLDDVQSVSDLTAAVQTLQTNAVPATVSSVSPSTNATIASVTNAAAIAFKLNATYTLTQYTLSVTPVDGTSRTTYVDVPLVNTTQLAYVISNRGTSNTSMTPSITSLIVNDIRCVISGDGKTARLFFTSNGATQHDLSVTIVNK